MSVSAMIISTVKEPDKKIVLKYKENNFKGFINISNVNITDFNSLHNYLINKYDDVKYVRLNMVKTFNGSIIKIKELYKDELQEDIYPNTILVKVKNSYKLVVVNAKRAKEFVAFSSSFNMVTAPVLVYKDTETEKIKLLNLK